MSERPTNSSTYQPSSRWEKKYIISKANGQPVDPKAEYLVLRLDTDTHARTAALAWAAAIEAEAPALAADVRDRVKGYCEPPDAKEV